uniref:Uncharacterized protein n=1 Tax=Plectus sambesii TaxID=2011161 RepID=A0A914XHV4_9BILA
MVSDRAINAIVSSLSGRTNSRVNLPRRHGPDFSASRWTRHSPQSTFFGVMPGETNTTHDVSTNANRSTTGKSDKCQTQVKKSCQGFAEKLCLRLHADY